MHDKARRCVVFFVSFFFLKGSMLDDKSIYIIQGGPLAVINGVITPINGLMNG